MSPAGALLLRVAVSPEAAARAAWAEVERSVDIPALQGADIDPLCLAALRLAELGVGPRERALAVGVARHAWASDQLALAELASLSALAGQPPVLAGRLATVVGYLPPDRVLRVGALELARRPVPTVEAAVLGHPVLVPSPAAHLVNCLLEGRWVDAAWMTLATEPPWPAVTAEAGRRRQRVAVLRGLRTLSALLGEDLVRPAREAGIGPSPLGGARERGWAAVYAATRPLRSPTPTTALAPAPQGGHPAARPS